MTFQVFNPSVSSLASGIGTIGTPDRVTDAVCPVLTWSHSVVSQSSGVFTIPQGYKAVLMHGLYVETTTAGPALQLETRWYNNSASAYIGCASHTTVSTGGASTLLRVPCAMAMVDASAASVAVTLRAFSWSATTVPLSLVGSRVDYLGDSWVSIMTVLA
jgi:hypothetical protein